ncbi:MAG: phosphotransferase [Rickettsiales bacterium]|nr:phosphotransferase [Rickettsiales bacterium]
MLKDTGLTPERDEQITAFLSKNGFGKASRHRLKGDASFRRYERLNRSGDSFMLMDAPPKHEDVRPFIEVSRLLDGYALSVPEIYARDEAQGLLIIEDLGDHLYSHMLQEEPEREMELYQRAVDLLISIYLQGNEIFEKTEITLQPYDIDVCLKEVGLVIDWFMPQLVGLDEAKKLKKDYLALWKKVFKATPCEKPIPVLRDYHADNLMWLSERSGLRRVGLLDYQDALLGDPAYDLASFLEDIRRDVAPETIEELLRYYKSQTDQDDEAFDQRYAVQAALRNAKIVGIFTRLPVRDGKKHYVKWLPAVWKWLQHDLEHPALSEVKAWFDEHVPADKRGELEVDVSIGGLA